MKDALSRAQGDPPDASILILVLEVNVEDADVTGYGGKDAETKPIAVEVRTDAGFEIVRYVIRAKVDYQKNAEGKYAQDWAKIPEYVHC